MVGVAAVFLLILAAPAPAEGAGDGRGAGPSVAELRARARPTFSFAPAVGLGLNFGNVGFGYDAIAKLGFGLTLEAGVVIHDRSALTLQLMGTFLPPTEVFTLGRGGYVMTGGGPSLDWFVSDRWSVGTGTHLHAYFGGLNSFSLMVPFRAHWRAVARDRVEVNRSSFVVGLQLGLGFSLIGLNLPTYPLNLTVSGLLTLGHGWW